ncbi:helix-turn-helix transcriptional regulator [Dyella sp. GSA-30]|uniref:helix-turn-helix domain-containing protein n=1 Tax=Dyella sp. GSA-30 TaxID=2994496 RepID=UPI002492261A|nr:helix-turn-helix transcriptional regulator [Dyella sp. GSA-30]BDU21626.1 transcriptional regulator [Dyella sp. GSA-30]
MARSTHHHDYQLLLTLLRELREKAGITQTSLAENLENTQTFVSKVERGERRIDAVEFVELCEALGHSPVAVFQEFLRRRVAPKGRGRKLSSRH